MLSSVVYVQEMASGFSKDIPFKFYTHLIYGSIFSENCAEMVGYVRVYVCVCV